MHCGNWKAEGGLPCGVYGDGPRSFTLTERVDGWLWFCIENQTGTWMGYQRGAEQNRAEHISSIKGPGTRFLLT